MFSSRLSLLSLYSRRAAIHNSASCSYRPNESSAGSSNTSRPLFKSFAERLGSSSSSSGGRQAPLPSKFPSGATATPRSRPPMLSGKVLLQQKIQERIKERLDKVRKEESGGQERAARDEEIKSAIITLISEEGVVLGAHPLAKVLHEMDRAQNTLVLVDPQQDPPACRVFSRKLIYERERLARKQRKAAPKQPRPQTIVLSESIGVHDLQIKINRAQEMLAKGKRVTMVVESKGRQRSSEKRAEVGASIMKQLAQHASVCAPPVLEPNSWSVALQGKAVASPAQ
ncbi:hypothetical protein GGH94_000080 [Coemansia aciculifera]|uniref:Translation initiation factor 3 N-terminal domain-containing protein n=1 Tax=Coemansia aciculifera TaxID=417176 RepID=A0A9W8IP03_9FUNG|nr:hypothetical protein GGH94_000080 [Coemansia aciculifera]KAJ2877322.1 hypothetical protein GGH93_000063 [Coemansia aciculifera]